MTFLIDFMTFLRRVFFSTATLKATLVQTTQRIVPITVSGLSRTRRLKVHKVYQKSHTQQRRLKPHIQLLRERAAKVVGICERLFQDSRKLLVDFTDFVAIFIQ